MKKELYFIKRGRHPNKIKEEASLADASLRKSGYTLKRKSTISPSAMT